MTDRFNSNLPSPPARETWTVCEQCGRWPAIAVVVHSIDGHVVYRKRKTSQPISLCKACGVVALHHGQQVAGSGGVILNLFAPYVLARNQKWLARLKRLPDPRPVAHAATALQSPSSPEKESAASSERALPPPRRRAVPSIKRALPLLRSALALLRRALAFLKRRSLPLLRSALALVKKALALLRRALAFLRRRSLPLLRRALALLRKALALLRHRSLPLRLGPLPRLRLKVRSSGESAASSQTECAASSAAETLDDLVTRFVTDLNDRLAEGARLVGIPIPEGFAEYEALGNYGGGLAPSERDSFSLWLAWVLSRSGYIAMEVPAETQIEIVMYRLEDGEISVVSVDEGKRAAKVFPHLLRLSKDVDRIVSSTNRVVPASQMVAAARTTR